MAKKTKLMGLSFSISMHFQPFSVKCFFMLE